MFMQVIVTECQYCDNRDSIIIKSPKYNTSIVSQADMVKFVLTQHPTTMAELMIITSH